MRARAGLASLDGSVSRLKRDLFLASFLMLFVEIALIRWLGENVLYLSYFTNFVLLASFLGIGIGFLLGSRDLGWFRWAGHLLLAAIAVVTVFPIRIDRSAAEVLFLGSGTTTGAPIWLALPIVFTLSAAVMAAIGHGVARLFGQLPPIDAYRVDILGSICGVIAFVSLSFLGAPPIVWGLVAVALYLVVLEGGPRGPHWVLAVGIVLTLGIQSLNPAHQWSPYYKVTTLEVEDVISIGTNGIPHQAMASTDYLDDVGWVASRTFAFLGIEEPGNVLIIGAGSGNDVAFALRSGAESIDAVEIDPVIYEQGVALHPDKPYYDIRVNGIIDDGRAFIERSDESYDLVLFAVTDSLTLISGQSSLRLESFLFTREAIEATKALLAPGGVLALYNLHTEQWVIDRMGRTLQETFGQNPCYRNEGGIRGVTIAVGEGARCEPTNTRDFANAADPATDDSPFLYLREGGIPLIYVWALAGVLAISAIAVRSAVRRLSALMPYADLVLMGVAFLLLETKGIVQFALWFGTTWLVNAIVFVSILISVLAAIEVVARFEVPSFKLLYALLGGSLLLAWSLPPSALLTIPGPVRLVVAAVVVFTPVFLANVIFAERFKDVASSTEAFGANLLGAMIGGVLEYSSLLMGYRNLSIFVGILYAIAFVLLRRIDSANRVVPM